MRHVVPAPRVLAHMRDQSHQRVPKGSFTPIHRSHPTIRGTQHAVNSHSHQRQGYVNRTTNTQRTVAVNSSQQHHRSLFLLSAKLTHSFRHSSVTVPQLFFVFRKSHVSLPASHQQRRCEAHSKNAVNSSSTFTRGQRTAAGPERRHLKASTQM